MNQINVFNRDVSYSILCNQVKYLLGYNYLLKYQFLQIIRQYYSRTSSEKREECKMVNTITINNIEVNPRSSMMWEVSDLYNLTEELKLGGKSLVTLYFETKMRDKMYFDSMNTIEILFQSLESEINEDDSLNVTFNSVNAKTLLKFMKVLFLEDDMQMDEHDISYEKIILIQLKMIQFIMERKIYNSPPIVIVHAPLLTQDIIRAVWSIPKVFTFVFTDEYLVNMNIKDIALFENFFVDCRDIELIYRILDQRYCKLILLDEMEEQMKQYILKIYYKEHTNLTDYLASKQE